MRLTIITTLAALLLAASAAQAERIEVPKDRPTLQAAIDVARNGDEIVLRGDQVGMIKLSGKSGLTIRGKGKPRVGDIDIVGCSDIRIQGLVVEGSGGASLYMYAVDDVTIRKCTIQDAPGNGVLIDQGGRVVIERCRIERTGECGIVLEGYGTGRVSRDCQLIRNRIRGAGEAGIAVCDGVDTTVWKNVVTDSDVGIYAGPREEQLGSYNDSITIDRNRVERCRMGVAVVYCSNNLVQSNRCDDVTELAFTIAGDDRVPGSASRNRFEKNRANRSENGFFIAADDNTLANNKARHSTASGFLVLGVTTTRNALHSNKATRSAEHGFHVMGTDHLLDANVATRSDGCGFYMDASGCRLTHNRAKKSGDYDLDDWRGGNSYSGNHFPTIAPPRGVFPAPPGPPDLIDQ